MSTRHFTPEEFARDGVRQATEDWKLVATEAVGEDVRRAARLVQELTPVGVGEERARKASGAQTPMIDSWFFFEAGLTGSRRQLPLAAAQLVRYRFGRTYGVANDAGHAPTINRGRKVLSTGRMGGSERARRGIVASQGKRSSTRGVTKPLDATLAAQQDSIIAEAIRRAEPRMRTG